MSGGFPKSQHHPDVPVKVIPEGGTPIVIGISPPIDLVRSITDGDKG